MAREICEATSDDLLRAIRAAVVVLQRELAAQWGIGETVAQTELNRCLDLIAAYERVAGITLTPERCLIADIKQGRERLMTR